MAVEIIRTDLDTGDRERVVLHGSNHVVVPAGDAYVHYVNIFSNGTCQVTIRGRDRVVRQVEQETLPPLTAGASSAPDGETVHDVAATLVRLADNVLIPMLASREAVTEQRREVLEQLGRLPLFADVLDFPLDPETSGPTIREYVNGASA